MMKSLNYLVLGGVVFFMIYILWGPIATGSNGRPQRAVIQVENGMLTASVREISLIDILDKLADQTGMGFELYTETDRKISVNYSRISLDEGLKRMVSPFSCIIVYTGKNSLSKKADIKKIIVYDKFGGGSGHRIKRQTSRSVVDREEYKKPGARSIQKSEKTDAVKSLEAYAE